MTLSVLDGHSSITSLFNWNVSYIFAPDDKTLLTSTLHGPFAIAELLVNNSFDVDASDADIFLMGCFTSSVLKTISWMLCECVLCL